MKIIIIYSVFIFFFFIFALKADYEITFYLPSRGETEIYHSKNYPILLSAGSGIEFINSDNNEKVTLHGDWKIVEK